MNIFHLTRIAAAAAIIAIPTAALAAPDQNSNGQNNNQCTQWNNNGQCVQWNNNGNGNGNGNGQWQNNGRQGGHGDQNDNRDNRDNRDDGNNGNHYGWNNGRGNPHGNNNGNYGYGNNGYGNGNRGGSLSGTVSSFSPYNLYLNNGTHVELHNGTVINPTGINLYGGQRVRISGNWNADGTFNANQIDVAGNGYGR
jgi:hypothetical protein